MTHDYQLLAPGPVNLHPEVRRILSLPMIHHRTPEFDLILSRVLKNLKAIFQTQQPVLMHSSTGTGGMESLLVNLLAPKDKVLAIVSGKFGERWAEMAKIFGGEVDILNLEWGKAAPLHQIQEQLKNKPDYSLVLCQACETSTGIAHPIKEISEIVHQQSSALFLVDGITAVGAYPIHFDDWKIDAIVAGSQKAFMLPTGMSFICLSQRAWQKCQNNPTPRYYFDLRLELKANQKGETLFSSNVPIIRALDFVLLEIEKIGLKKHFQIIRRRADFTRHFIATRFGLPLFAETPSDSLTAFLVPSDLDSQDLRQKLESQYNTTLMGGQDQAKGKILRIGHMGYILDEHLKNSILDIFDLLRNEKPNLLSAIQKESLEQEIESWLATH